MKKNSMLALGVSLALGLAACSSSTQSGKTLKSHTAVVAATSGIDLTAIDNSVRPQDDLFRYVNGTWLKNTEIPADKSGYSTFNILYDDTQQDLKTLIQDAATSKAEKGSNTQKLGDMYNSYMDLELANQKGLSPLKTQISEIANIENMQQVSEKFGQLLTLGVGGTFNFYVSPDAKKPEIVTMYLYQSGLTLPDRDYYSKDEQKFVNFRAATEKYMADLLAKAQHPSAKAAAKRLMALEKDIASKHVSRVESRDADKNYNKLSTTELQKMLGNFDWQAYADASGVGKVKDLVVRNTPYFEKVADLFSLYDVQTWKDYLTFNLLDTYAPRLGQDMVDLHFAFHSTTLHGIPEQKPRWKNAVAATSSVLGEVLGKQYVDKHFPPIAKAKMDTLVKNITKAYGESIAQLKWMSKETKQSALEKLAAFTPKIGYPDKWRDYSSLDIKADDLVGNYIRYSIFNHNEEVSKIGKPVDKNDWGMTPQTINAYYSPVRNEIVFPAAILQYPFFNLEADDAVNYGAIGAVIGHEIGHGFDDQGAKYDGQGKLRSWWTDEDRAAFDVLAAKLVTQFDAFEPIEGQHVNGKLTLGENIGDLAGVNIGYKAYQMSLAGKQSKVIDGFTGEQRFFMGYAQVWRGKYREDTLRAILLSDPHSPGEYRINGIVGNVDAFYQAFDVKQGDALYLKPEDRVNIW
ncbi:M13-type metalloendopeptidase [Paraglaciecola aquimarina]|uniref:M13-type metalloendopeptidase n=1 Tax=Paraglaciecola aquimarina TaxID=1235557 RepID=A0ABU3T0M7_9ALTE|nr:M13-type metalloendopeptidase [Paraglaciecola aquimarina]MDU0355819.1 M13-type metalloendopeptidase [Paraglaciecola aquimarina]